MFHIVTDAGTGLASPQATAVMGRLTVRTDQTSSQLCVPRPAHLTSTRVTTRRVFLRPQCATLRMTVEIIAMRRARSNVVRVSCVVCTHLHCIYLHYILYTYTICAYTLHYILYTYTIYYILTLYIYLHCIHYIYLHCIHYMYLQRRECAPKAGSPVTPTIAVSPVTSFAMVLITVGTTPTS